MPKSHRFLTIFVQAILLGHFATLGHAASELIDLVDLGQFDARGVSNGGQVVVGDAEGHAVRWTATTRVLEKLGAIGTDTQSIAWRVSADGSTIVGDSFGPSGPGLTHAFQWTQSEGMVELAPPSEAYVINNPWGVSADGSVVVGMCRQENWTEMVATRWTNGGVEVLGPGWANAVSADGAVVAVNGDGNQAYRWTETNGLVGLGSLPDSLGSWASAVSADGSVVVGFASFSSTDPSPPVAPREAFRWTPGEGMVGLGVPSDWDSSAATGVSGGGSLVVGYLVSGDQPYVADGFIWDPANGMRPIKQVLADDFGIDVSDWEQLGGELAISPDGTAILGNGTKTNGESGTWLARLSPVSLIERYLDGLVTTGDLTRRQAEVLSFELGIAQTLYNRFRRRPACVAMGAFAFQVQNYRRRGLLNAVAAQDLSTWGKSFRTEMGCTF